MVSKNNENIIITEDEEKVINFLNEMELFDYMFASDIAYKTKVKKHIVEDVLDHLFQEGQIGMPIANLGAYNKSKKILFWYR